MTPSSSVDQIGVKAARKAEIAAAMGLTEGGAPPASSAPAAAAVISQCIAQFQWRARNEEDLSFAKGDTIEVESILLRKIQKLSEILELEPEKNEILQVFRQKI